MTLLWGALTEVHDVWVRPSVRQRLALALFSIGVGLIAGTGGLALIVADQDSDPRNVFAFTPLQTLAVGTAVPIPVPQVPPVKTVLAREVTDSNTITPEITKRENGKPCRSSPNEADSPCVSGPKSNPEPAAPESNLHAAVVVPTGHVSDGTIVAELHAAASRESTSIDEVSATRSTGAAPAVVETPTQESATTKPGMTERRQGGQRHPSQQSWAFFNSRPRRGRQQHFWPFW